MSDKTAQRNSDSNLYIGWHQENPGERWMAIGPPSEVNDIGTFLLGTARAIYPGRTLILAEGRNPNDLRVALEEKAKEFTSDWLFCMLNFFDARDKGDLLEAAMIAIRTVVQLKSACRMFGKPFDQPPYGTPREFRAVLCFGTFYGSSQ